MKQEHKALDYVEKQLQKEIEDKWKQMSEQALLEHEEKEVKEWHKKTEERQKARLERKATELEKQRERECERREKRKKKIKEMKDDEEEEAPMIDDVDKDKDYDPEDDREAEFITKVQELEKEDTFEVEKHVHVANIKEAGDYLVVMNR